MTKPILRTIGFILIILGIIMVIAGAVITFVGIKTGKKDVDGSYIIDKDKTKKAYLGLLISGFIVGFGGLITVGVSDAIY